MGNAALDPPIRLFQQALQNQHPQMDAHLQLAPQPPVPFGCLLQIGQGQLGYMLPIQAIRQTNEHL
jgi:hypothetical protein